MNYREACFNRNGCLTYPDTTIPVQSLTEVETLNVGVERDELSSSEVLAWRCRPSCTIQLFKGHVTSAYMY